MNRFVKLVSLLSLSLILSAPVACTRTDNKSPSDEQNNATKYCYLWKVASKDNHIYLLGTIHFGAKDLYPLPKAIDDAFSKSEVLVMETNPEKVNKIAVMNFINKKGTLPPRERLTKRLTAKTADRLKAYCKKKKISIGKIERFRPWVVAILQIAAVEVKAAGFDAKHGIDMHFLKKAKKKRMRIRELESTEEQLNAIGNYDRDLQDKLLLKTLMEIENLKSDVEKMIAVWKRGDVKAMQKLAGLDLIDRDPSLKTFYKKFWDERNATMTKRMSKYLKGDKTAFVMVGAGHLGGDKGILKLLKDKGYRVTQIKQSK